MSGPCAHNFAKVCTLCKMSQGAEPLPIGQLADLAVYQCRELLRQEPGNKRYAHLLGDAITFWDGVQMNEQIKQNAKGSVKR